jgi:predicted transposase YbfD/YdcC
MPKTDAYDRLRILLDSVPDHRKSRGLRHPLADVLFIMLVGVVCGQEDAEAIEDFANANKRWFEQRCGLRHGIPSQDTYLRVLAGMDPEAFADAFRAWVDDLWSLAKSRHVAIDGKTLRRSFDRAAGLNALHSVAAFVSDSGLVIGSVPVESRDNEITAIPTLLRLLDLNGATVTIDAIGCQTAIAAQIHQAGGRYLLQVKNNQPTLRKDLDGFFRDAERPSRPLDDPQPTVERVTEVEKGHGRLETRSAEVSRDLSWVDKAESWEGLASVIRVTRSTIDLTTGAERVGRALYISNDSTLDATSALALSRRHWAIENEMHWILDVTFDEDQSRVRTGNAAKNLATIRRAGLNLVTTAPSPRNGASKISTARRRRIAGLDEHYREAVLRLEPLSTPS